MNRWTAATTVMLTVMLSGCEHPLPPTHPGPLPAAAEQLSVPAPVLLDLRETSDLLQHVVPPGTSPPAVSGLEAERLRRTLRLLETSYRTRVREDR